MIFFRKKKPAPKPAAKAKPATKAEPKAPAPSSSPKSSSKILTAEGWQRRVAASGKKKS